MIRAVLIALCLAPASVALGHEYQAGDLMIDHPVIYKSFARARAAGGYMTITNTGDADDLLIGISTEGPMAMLHESREEEGVMRMIHLDAVEVPAGATVSFAPGGLHVMFMGLAPEDLPVGDRLDATLLFDRAGEVAVTFHVEELPKDGHVTDHSQHGGITH